MLVTICEPDKNETKRLRTNMDSAAADHGLKPVIVDFASADELARSIRGKMISPDIVVVDADDPSLPGTKSSELLRNAGYEGVLIIVSRSEAYAIPGYDVGAFNYAIKGDRTDERRFQMVFLKAAAFVAKRKRKRILLNGITERRNAPLDSIMYFEVKGRICTVHFVDGDTMQLLTTLDALDAKLSAYGFIRTHRTGMVNIAKIDSCTHSTVILVDGTILPLGRTRHDDVLEAYEKVAGNRREAAVVIDDGEIAG